jgi:PAS domain S-box-containing protein
MIDLLPPMTYPGSAWLCLGLAAVAAWCAQRAHARASALRRLQKAFGDVAGAEADLRELINTIPALAWSTRPDGSSDFFNERWLSYTGLTAEESLGWGWRVAVHPDDLAGLQDRWTDVLVSGAPGERPMTPGREARLRRYDGEYRWFFFRGSPLHDETGRVIGWCGTNVDIEDRKRAEAALRSREYDLSVATQNAMVGEFAASVAHEINQPLSGIITNASTCLRMLAADPPNVSGALETARRTLRDGNRASEVITRLRALFKKQGTTTESVDLNRAAREVVALLMGELHRNQVSLQTALAADLPAVTGDQVQLQQVILNLLRNAIDAMSGVPDRPRHLVIRTALEGNQVRLTVQDSGAGFEAGGGDKIFNAFYTTKREGMGVGLSVSRSIIENHRGRIWAEANEGPGTTFSFSIPVGIPVEAP